jgi:hypothetical protein
MLCVKRRVFAVHKKNAAPPRERRTNGFERNFAVFGGQKISLSLCTSPR